ncbi:mediator complex subunit rgr-1 [Culex quinquefasciatus]|uniref:Mediator complex subunit rgr-1 n=1 Tax=Culex quinquefasciatus TaxID=7176 RepID=B0XHG6_CULQU|nr:mediator complex subunit rgr-1 [Culex quinquefasciatus]|eukprot:XP_001869088.1 mediator complex subunit rgr-1 [Culex quinquefasciatus]
MTSPPFRTCHIPRIPLMPSSPLHPQPSPMSHLNTASSTPFTGEQTNRAPCFDLDAKPIRKEFNRFLVHFDGFDHSDDDFAM